MATDEYGQSSWGQSEWGGVDLSTPPVVADTLPKVVSFLELIPPVFDTSATPDGIAIRFICVALGASDNDIGGQ